MPYHCGKPWRMDSFRHCIYPHPQPFPNLSFHKLKASLSWSKELKRKSISSASFADQPVFLGSEHSSPCRWNTRMTSKCNLIIRETHITAQKHPGTWRKGQVPTSSELSKARLECQGRHFSMSTCRKVLLQVLKLSLNTAQGSSAWDPI